MDRSHSEISLLHNGDNSLQDGHDNRNSFLTPIVEIDELQMAFANKQRSVSVADLADKLIQWMLWKKR